MTKAEVNSGKRAGVPTDAADKVTALERKVRELRQANEIVRDARDGFGRNDPGQVGAHDHQR